jgi:hypothetical protein
MKKMNHKIELITLITAGLASQFATDLLLKTIITIITMVIGTTVAFFWKKFLESRDKNKKE